MWERSGMKNRLQKDEEGRRPGKGKKRRGSLVGENRADKKEKRKAGRMEGQGGGGTGGGRGKVRSRRRKKKQ